MTALATKRLSYEDYLALDAASEQRLEFWSGEVWAMAGGTPDHARIGANAIGELYVALRRSPCSVSTADQRIWLAEADMAVYPDLSVICGPIVRPVHDAHAATNPTLVLEVLSPATASRDRGEKRYAYMRAPTVQHIVLVASDRVEVERWTRLDTGAWEVRTLGPGAPLELPALGVRVEVDALYADTELISGAQAG